MPSLQLHSILETINHLKKHIFTKITSTQNTVTDLTKNLNNKEHHVTVVYKLLHHFTVKIKNKSHVLSRTRLVLVNKTY